MKYMVECTRPVLFSTKELLMTSHAELGAIFLALRANGSLDKPVPKIPPAPKPTRRERALERLFRNDSLRIIRDGAEGADLEVLPVSVRHRGFSRMRLLIDGELCEIHHLRCRHRGEPSCNFRRATFNTVKAHILLVDIREERILRAFRIPSTYLEKRFFFRPEKSSGDLRISLKPGSAMELFELAWTLSRTPPPEA